MSEGLNPKYLSMSDQELDEMIEAEKKRLERYQKERLKDTEERQGNRSDSSTEK